MQPFEHVLTHLQTTQSLASLSAQFHANLASSPSTLSTCSINANSLDNISLLYDFWKTNSPEAGSQYWAVRTWTMLTWQPVCLALIGAYASNEHINFDGFQQHQNAGITSGYQFLQSHVIRPKNSANEVCKSLNRLLAGYLNSLQKIVPLQESIAHRLVRDQLAKFILQMSELMPVDHIGLARYVFQKWSEQLSFNDKDPYLAIDINTETTKWLLKRSACCQHFKRHDGGYCVTCPKQNKQQKNAALERYKQKQLQQIIGSKHA
ncbi:siderophore ferric iron reductase [Psychromonas sp. Urea-02u-13]|uniref:siderophore ferric iron reductase n=1 Tax=Psychromonas sp. Urea-02u-13 TaxID=2058326 RepID=UPI0012FEA044|nr:siderophore ferric iron reductase [Psychromonas sp. Urea-02u-13]